METKTTQIFMAAFEKKNVGYRVVEKATGMPLRTVHRLHNDDGFVPKPAQLRVMAEYYGIKFTDVMQAAGHIADDEMVIVEVNEGINMAERQGGYYVV